MSDPSPPEGPDDKPNPNRAAAGGPLSRLRGLPSVRLLSGGSFARYSLGNVLSLCGTWGQRMAAGWLVWEWTGSGFWLGVLAAADLAPVLVIGPFAGVVADRWPRLQINRVFQAMVALISTMLAVLMFSGLLSLGLLITLIGISGVLAALNQPARLAMVQELVPRADVGTAVAINATLFNVARLIGPALAALAIVRFDAGWVFLANALMTVGFVWVLGRLVLIPSTRKRPTGSVLAQIAEGMRFVLEMGSLRLVLGVMLLGGVLLRGVGELLPAFAARSFADAVTGLALMTSSLAAGAVLAGVLLGRQADDGAMMRASVWAWGWAAACTAGIAVGSHPVVALLCVAGLGGFLTRGMILSQSFMQLRTPDEMRGRVLSLHGLIGRASPALGALAVGTAIDHFGITASVLAASVAMAGCLLLLAPSARRHSAGLTRDG